MALFFPFGLIRKKNNLYDYLYDGSMDYNDYFDYNDYNVYPLAPGNLKVTT